MRRCFIQLFNNLFMSFKAQFSPCGMDVMECRIELEEACIKLKQACIELTLGNARSSIPASSCSSELTEWQDCQMSVGKRCGRKRRLLFRSGFYLSIRPDGSVTGTKDEECPFGKCVHKFCLLVDV